MSEELVKALNGKLITPADRSKRSPFEAFVVQACSRVCRPVRNVARDGAQSGVVTNAFSNNAPSCAMRSMFGVRTNEWFMQPRLSHRRSSTSTSMMLGGLRLEPLLLHPGSNAVPAAPLRKSRRETPVFLDDSPADIVIHHITPDAPTRSSVSFVAFLHPRVAQVL